MSTVRNWFNLMVTFLVSGLWHGASWTFVVWGMVHGMYLIISQAVGPYTARLGKTFHAERFPAMVSALKILLTFGAVTVAWAFFRAKTLSDAWFVVTHLLPLGRLDPFVLKVGGFTRATAPFLTSFLVGMFVVERWIAHPSRTPKVWASPVFRALSCNVCIYSIVFFGFFGHRDFIYFQF